MRAKPVIVRNEQELASLLRGRREALGMPQDALDHRVGWAESYCAKVEAPNRRYGKRVLWGMSDLLNDWLEALGLALVIMPRADAEALIASCDAPDLTTATPRAYPGRKRKHGLARQDTISYDIVFTQPLV